MALIGTMIGIVLAFLLFRGLHSVLCGVKSTGLVTLASVSALLLRWRLLPASSRRCALLVWTPW
jgi:hypothetical protein